MNMFERAFHALYNAQTRSLGVKILATITGYGVNRPAILGIVDADIGIVEGGTGELAGYELQMKVSDLSGEPPKGTAVTCNGAAAGKSLQTAGPVSNRGAIYLIQLKDFAAMGK
jgi:hypothetical protein